VELFLHFFDLMGNDLLDFVEDSRLRGCVNKQINKTSIVLIPKSNHSKRFSEFRPISLCNLCYKIISKIISRRIRPILSKALSEEQLGFLKGRQILDAIGTTQECLYNIRTKKLHAILLKLDLNKAFDSINWDFLRLILLECGFGVTTTRWVMGCISSTLFTVLINREATKAFHCERGLRQGCPLSPLLFILVLECLSILLKRSQAVGKLTGIKVLRLIKILHLLFVDDVIIMTGSTMSEWIEIHKIINTFCLVSGMKINFHKSTFLAMGVRETTLDELKYLFNIDSSNLSEGFKYLGFHLKPTNYKATDWSWLTEKFEHRIHHWCYRLLSLGGRFILVKVVLESLHVYWMVIAHFPLSVIKKIRQLIFEFLWSGSKQRRGFHLCKWQEISKPKSLGGWGLRNLYLFYRALSANIFWRVLMKPDIWNKVVKDK
jgi:hypothetical protein